MFRKKFIGGELIRVRNIAVDTAINTDCSNKGQQVFTSKEKWVEVILSDIQKRLASGERHIIIRIAGKSAAGKSTMVEQLLAGKFKEAGISVSDYPMDHHNLGNKFIAAYEHRTGVLLSWDDPRFVDVQAAVDNINMLKQGSPVSRPVFNFKTVEPTGERVLIKPAQVVILEGIFALDERFGEGDITAGLDLSTHGSILRRLFRDPVRSGLAEEVILDYYLTFVHPAYIQHIASPMSTAQYVLINEYDPATESARSNLQEFQCKFKLENELAAALRDDVMLIAGEKTKEEDHYFKGNEKDLRAATEMVRVRYGSGKPEFMYKGPMKSNEGNRERNILKFPISPQIVNKFKDIWEFDYIIKKERTIFLPPWDEFEIVLDMNVARIENGQTIQLGNFLELRANTKEQYAAGLEWLQKLYALQKEQVITAPYSLMSGLSNIHD